MKKILLICALGLFAWTAGAQEVAKKPSWKGFVTNGFWDNWELSVGGGMNYVAWDGLGFSGQANRSDNIGWALEGTATKWFSPVIGMRAQLIGGRLYMSDGKGNKYDSSYILPHVDGIANLSNWIGGYREDRVFYAKLFAGFGANFTGVRGDNVGEGFVFDAGLLGSFRVCKSLDINIEGKFFLSPTKDMPYPVSQVGGKIDQIYSLTIGATYRFNKRNWDKAYSQEEVDGYLAAIAALEAGLADAHRNEGKLAERLAAQKAATDQALKDNEALKAELAKRKTSVVSASALFFNFDSAMLLDRAKASMQILQEVIKAAPKDQVFTIVGHADAKTGSPEYNQKLSERRAKAVYDYLVEQGVNPNQLTWKGVGSSQNIFPVNGTNRVVIVK